MEKDDLVLNREPAKSPVRNVTLHVNLYSDCIGIQV